jgi:hypothetical protein
MQDRRSSANVARARTPEYKGPGVDAVNEMSSVVQGHAGLQAQVQQLTEQLKAVEQVLQQVSTYRALVYACREHRY